MTMLATKGGEVIAGPIAYRTVNNNNHSLMNNCTWEEKQPKGLNEQECKNNKTNFLAAFLSEWRA